jgi:C-terminal processing protease CtpA/Prc
MVKAEGGTVKIVSILPGSFAEKANLQAEDEIISIEGKRTSELDAENIGEYFSAGKSTPGKGCTFVIRQKVDKKMTSWKWADGQLQAGS